ncbi:CHASE3 domain-containing protein [Flammeovirgaceae bacterium SG7u.111]|nr:CHASE3 domain-containing protein [Flammeovirgaceae bacterium SG7u.132]WPO33485.1 CHASE3 domain-containing protein [Flammeovirgaceae bacterium SG7u.111]
MRNINKIAKNNKVTYLLYAFITLLAINSAVLVYTRYTVQQISKLEDTNQEISDYLANLETQIRLSDLGLRGYLLIQEDRFLAPHFDGMENYPIWMEKLENTMADCNLINDKWAKYKEMIHAKMLEADEIVGLTKDGDIDGAMALLNKDSGMKLWEDKQAFESILFEHQDNLKADLEKSYNRVTIVNLVTGILLVLVGFPALIIAVRSLKRSDEQRELLIEELSESSKQYIFNDGETVEYHNEKEVIDKLAQDLKRASDFITSITKGDYSVRWDGLNEKNRHLNTDNLAAELVEMRDQMFEVKTQEERRIWVNEGIAILSEIIRKNHQTLTELADEFILELVKYIGANQGSIFTLKKNNNEMLEMVSCYAYSRKKYLNMEIKVGEGLVGQVFAEKETTFLKEIPEKYIKISSGLGDARPRSLVLVPLKVNENTEGVLELASFKEFDENTIDFLEKACEILASSFISVRVNEKTTALLEQQQAQTEQLRAQEEEMRQNMEEMEATQEEMMRKEQEISNLLEESRENELMLNLRIEELIEKSEANQS